MIQLFVASITFFSFSVWSQDLNQSKSTVEKIEVTGSHIKRVDTEGASPVETLTRKDLEKTGYNSVGDVLRDTSVSSFGAAREASGSNAASNASVDLRGLGASNTLVLLNGQRLPADAVTGAVDLNLIPMAAVERVEILKDGASAIYGSDALGGVVNIITRKDFTGSEISLVQSIPQEKGGAKREISLVNGINTARTSMVNVLNYRENETVFSKDRAFFNNGFSNIGSPGTYRNEGGKWQADPNCPADRLKVTPAGTFCTFKYTDYSTQLPSLQQLSILSDTNYELSSKVKLQARVGGTQKKAKWSYAPSPGRFTIPGDQADTLGLPGAEPGEDLEVQYRLLDLGTRDTEITTYSYNGLLGSTIDLGQSWELQVNATHSAVNNRDEGVSGYALTKDIEDGIASGQFNPFAPAGARGQLVKNSYKPLEETISRLTTVEAKTSGELAQLESGPIGLAVGTSAGFQRYEDKYDDKSKAGEVFGSAGSIAGGGGERESNAVFSEVSIPIVKKLELQLAGRYDHYSDFGDTVNPKAAVLYHVSPILLVRSSVGTGFKAPLMQDLYASPTSGYPTFIDDVACKNEIKAGGKTPSCAPQQYPVTSSGNRALKEERSLSYNMGAVLEPSRNFNFGTDFFVTRVNNVVGIDYNEATRAESLGANLAERGVIVERDSDGYITKITAPAQNLTAQELSGVDLTSTVRAGHYKLSVEHSQLLYFRQEGFPGMGLKDLLGESGRPAWKNTIGLGYDPNERNSFNVALLTTAENGKADPGLGKLNQYTTVDLQYAFNSKDVGTITAGIKNVLGTVPPLDDSDPTASLNTSLYDQIGRQFYAGYKTTF